VKRDWTSAVRLGKNEEGRTEHSQMKFNEKNKEFFFRFLDI